MDKTDYGKDNDKTPGTELFSRKYTDRYKKVTGTDGNTYYIYNDNNTFNTKSLYSITNIEVNPDVLKDVAVIPLHLADGKVDYDKGKELTAVFSKENLTYGSGTERLTFERFYEAIIDDIGSEGSVYGSMVNNQDTLTSGIDDSRQVVMGVSSDEELTNMIKYQQAYNAASRYINVITTMMDTLTQLV
jgi:flagellar hook-associated protein 1 FlgK